MIAYAGRIAFGILRSFAGASYRQCIMPAEVHCQANRGINAVGLRKLTKYCDSFRFLELFCVYFYWDGTFTISPLFCSRICFIQACAK